MIGTNSRRVFLTAFLLMTLSVPLFPQGTGVRVEGRIVSPDGRPLQGDVTLLETGRNARILNSRTNSQGVWGFDTDRSVKRLLIAKADGYISAEKELLSPSDVTKVTIVFVLSPSGLVSGRVIDEDGTGVPGALVRVRYPGERRSYRFGQELGEVSTDAFGYFTLPFVAQGRLFVLDALTDNRPLNSSAPFTLTGQSLSGLLVTLSRKGGAVLGKVLDLGGRPIANASVRMRALAEGETYSEDERQSISFVFNTNRGAATGSDGVYQFLGIPAGKVILVANRPGATPMKREAVISPGQTVELNFNLP